MKFKILTSLFLLTASQLLFAAISQTPEKCPSVDAIRSVGINEASYLNDGSWSFMIPNSNFDTNVHWQFIMEANFITNNMSEALVFANVALPDLEFVNGPVYDGKVWMCGYLPKDSVSSHVIFGMASTLAP